MTTRTVEGAAALMLAFALAALPSSAVCQHAHDDHAGHDHSSHAGEAEGHEEHTDEVTISPEAMKMFGIALETAVLRDLTDVSSVPARVAYNGEAMAHVGTPVAGRASEIHVKLGDMVAKGDLLAVIASPELGGAESDLLQKRSLVDAARSGVEVARIAFERAKELRSANGVSVSDFLARQGELKKTEAELDVAEAEHLAAENRLHILGLSQEQVERLVATGEVSSRFELRAPIGGTIVQREITPGEIVGPDREVLMVIADMSTLWVLADVPERVAHRVRTGSKGRISLGFVVGQSLEGTVDYVAPELNPRTRTAQVRLLVDPSGAVARSGAEQAGGDGHDDAEGAHADAVGSHDDHEGHDHEAGREHSDDEDAEDSHAAAEDSHDHHDGHDHEGDDHEPEEHSARASAPSPLLRPGMFADVELDLASVDGMRPEPVIAIPEEAIQTVEGRVAVFVPADEPDTFMPQPLVIGRRVGRHVHVISGLRAGDRYVSSGSFILKAELGKAGAEHVH